MGYLFLLIALLSGTTKGYCGKKTSGYVSEYKDSIAANIIRMILCIAIGFLMLLAQGQASLLKTNSQTLIITLVSGITTSLFVTSWLVSVKRGAYMLVDVFLMFGVLVTTILSRIFFAEEIGLKRWIGIAVLFAALLIMCSYNNQVKAKIDLKSLLLLSLCGGASGLTDFSQKVFVKTVENGNAAVFNFYTYVFSALTLILLLPIFCKGSSKSIDIKNFKKISIYIAIMAVCLFANSYFKTVAASYLTAAQLYPLNQGASLILSSVMAAVCFGEKPNSRSVLGLTVAFVGLIIMNVL